MKLWQDPTGGCEDLRRQRRAFAKLDRVIVHTKEVSDALTFTLILLMKYYGLFRNLRLSRFSSWSMF